MLVTGALGFLGRAVVRAAVRGGWTVVGAPDSEAVDVVVHLRAWANAQGCEVDPERACRENVVRSLRVGAVAREVGAKGIAYASTTAVYASSSALVRADSPVAPLGVYALTKLAGEGALNAGSGGLPVYSVRLPNLYGYGQVGTRARGAVAHWLHSLSVGQPLEVYYDAHAAVRDYLHVDDAAEAVVRAALDVAGAGVRAAIAATGRSLTGLDVAIMVRDAWVAAGGDASRSKVHSVGAVDPVPAPRHSAGYASDFKCERRLELELPRIAAEVLSSARGTTGPDGPDGGPEHATGE